MASAAYLKPSAMTQLDNQKQILAVKFDSNFNNVRQQPKKIQSPASGAKAKTSDSQQSKISSFLKSASAVESFTGEVPTLKSTMQAEEGETARNLSLQGDPFGPSTINEAIPHPSAAVEACGF